VSEAGEKLQNQKSTKKEKSEAGTTLQKHKQKKSLTSIFLKKAIWRLKNAME
jgi:hypothetical protein